MGDDREMELRGVKYSTEKKNKKIKVTTGDATESERTRTRENARKDDDEDEREMGIKGLTGLLQDNAPTCVREQKFESYLDRKVAIDASMHIYQFMVRFFLKTRGRVRVENGD